MIMESLVLKIPPFRSGLDAAIAPQSLAIPTSPVNSILVPIVDPKLVVFKYHHHAAGSVRG